MRWEKGVLGVHKKEVFRVQFRANWAGYGFRLPSIICKSGSSPYAVLR